VIRALAQALLMVAGAPPAPSVAAVRVGLEVLEADEARLLRGRRVGLLCHAASVTTDGRHAVDVLRARGVTIARLFAPEHGLRGDAAAGSSLSDTTDPATGLPVVSLYGSRTRPTREQLHGLDVVVVDLQDAGVRFYTYVSTLILSLEAASDADVELVVLDRPNPLGGRRVGGPEADAVAPRSLLNTAPGPLVHGLTLGEMARYVNTRLPRPARLTVVAMKGWTREMTWTETGRPWVAPSPNLRTAHAALAYPGTCLLEATNVSEGRGTGEPFLLVGAPWLDPGSVAAAVSQAGFRSEPAAFTPRAETAAPHPKHEGRPCRGLQIGVTDPRSADPYRLGVGLLVALRRDPAFRWRDGGAALDGLVGTRRLRDAVDRGESVDAIVARDVDAVARFLKERAPALLY
jgi:uncharacterized protein YbbC (DUF1343 family)